MRTNAGFGAAAGNTDGDLAAVGDEEMLEGHGFTR
jgi:hypothetical protein